MRIAFCSVGPPYRGGISDFNYQLYRHLEGEHQLCFVNFKRQYPRLLFPGRSEYKRRRDRPSFASQRILDSLVPLSWYTTARRLAAFQPEVTIFRYWNPFFAPPLAFVAARLRRLAAGRTLVIVDNLIPHERSLIDRLAARMLLREMDLIVALSKGVAREIEEVAPQRRVHVLFHPLYELYRPKLDKSTARRKLGIPRDQTVFLFFGYIRPYKGVDVLLKAAAVLKKRTSNFQIWIVGEPYEPWEPYQAIIDGSHINEHLKLVLRFAGDTETPLFFAAADALVLPYKTATQSGILGIAYQAALPVIATEVGGLGEYVKPGYSGYLVKPDSPEELAGALEQFIQSRERVDFAANVTRWREQFTVERFVRELESIINA